MSNRRQAAVLVTTRWWWVRHAPVRNDGGNIYGQTDLACDTSDRVSVRGGRQESCPQGGLVFEQPEAHAPDRGSDLGGGISEACGDAA